MLKRGILWALVLLPGLLACVVVLLVAVAISVIHVINNAEAFAGTIEPIKQLARAVYERQRSIWQAQSGCIAFDEVLFYKPRPGKCEFNNVEYATVLTFDSRGFRETGLSGDKARRPFRGRVVVLGDSQAMGWGVQDEETFANVLAAEYGFEVFNLAVSSYGTARELLRLEREFILQRGDVVVIQYHPNDLHENRTFLKEGGLPGRVPSDLDRLAHTPQGYGVMQVTASIALILKGRLMQAFSGLPENEDGGAEHHAETFVAVTHRFPFLEQARVVVCEVASFGQATSFADDLVRLADGRVSVVKPVWEAGDFYRLDDHLTARGHRKLAGLIAAAVPAN